MHADAHKWVRAVHWSCADRLNFGRGIDQAGGPTDSNCREGQHVKRYRQSMRRLKFPDAAPQQYRRRKYPRGLRALSRIFMPP